MYRESSCGNLLQVEAAVLYPGLRPTVLRIRLRYNFCFFRALVLKFDNKNLANSFISSFFLYYCSNCFLLLVWGEDVHPFIFKCDYLMTFS